MANAAAGERRGARRFGRLVTRTLFVLGGAVAGSAAAWLVSDAVASADTIDSVNPAPLADTSLGDMVGDTSGLAQDVSCQQDATAWSEPQPGPGICGAIARGHVGGPAKQDLGSRVLEHEVSGRISDSVTDLAQDIQRSIGYYQSLNKDAQLTRLIGVGSTFRLPGLRKYLKQQLSMDVYRIENFKRLKMDGPRATEFEEASLNR